MSRQINVYRDKYLKYKTKYLELQHKFNILSGGGLATATNSFLNKLFKNKEALYNLFQHDEYLMEQLTINHIVLPKQIDSTFDSLQKNQLFKKIFDIIVADINENIMDNYIKLYLDGNFGIPNSIKNKDSYNNAQNIVKKLRNNKFSVPATFKSLTELEDFIKVNEHNLMSINKKTDEKTKGKTDVLNILITTIVKIYQPTTENGSKYYGNNTKWCTTGDKINRFNEYNDTGPFYIIVPKSNPKNKFQLHFERGELKDATNTSVTQQYLSELLKDEQFDNWFNNKLDVVGKIVNSELKINKWIPLFKQAHNILIKKLIFDDNFNQPLINSLNNLTKLEKLSFGNKFNQTLGNSLNELINLRQLSFGDDFNNQNELIGNSLNNLVKLEQLTFGFRFNLPLVNSLNGLTNLQQLIFDDKFNHPLGSSLNNLTNLQKLIFGDDFNQTLGNSLNELINLHQLTFGEKFNKYLGTSLYGLSKLQQLTFGDNFNESIDNSLDNLVDLRQLIFGVYFNNKNKPIANSLNKLTKIQQLTFGTFFNQTLGNSLDKLINLQQLTFGYEFNQTLGNSLNELINLQQLTFGDDYNNGNEPLGNSLDNLNQLHQLTFSDNFSQPFYNSLDKLINLQKLVISTKYSHQLPNNYNLKIERF
jgi:hypothetical protein